MLNVFSLYHQIYNNDAEWSIEDMDKFTLVIKNDKDQEFSIKGDVEIDFERQVIKLEAV